MEAKVVNPLPKDNDERIFEGSLRPRTLAEYVGQEKVRMNLAVFIEAARRRGESIDHILLYGPPGLGKTTLAYIVAHELGVDIKVSSGPVIERAGDLAAILTNLREKTSFFLTRSIDCPMWSRRSSTPQWRIFISTSSSGKAHRLAL